MILKVDDKGYGKEEGKAGVGEESGTRRASNTQTNTPLWTALGTA